MIAGPDGPIECLVTGGGTPVTVFAHGLAASIDETRPFGSGVDGKRVFFHFRGHGATVGSQAPWHFGGLAAELCAVVAAYGGSRALGVSLGAGALLRAAVSTPGVFDRLVLVLPAGIDRPRTDPAIERLQHQAELIERHDLPGLAAALVVELPASVRVRPDVQLWAKRQARRLSATSVARALRELPSQHPLDSRDELKAVECPVLLIAQEDDAAHPWAVARDLAEVLPRAELTIFGGGGLVWSHRAELRALISTFFNT